MKTLSVVAIVWSVAGIAMVLVGLPQSITGGWRSAIYLVLFGPPISILVDAVGEGFFEFLRWVFVPKSIDRWHPAWRVILYVFYAGVIFLMIALAAQFFHKT